MPDTQPTVAVLGTWGYYGLLDDAEQVRVDTPYGPTSDSIIIVRVCSSEEGELLNCLEIRA